MMNGIHVEKFHQHFQTLKRRNLLHICRGKTRSMWLVMFCLFRVVIMWYTLDLPSTCHPGFQLQIKIFGNSPIPKKNILVLMVTIASWGFWVDRSTLFRPFRIFFEVLFLTHSNHRNGTIRTLVNADALVTAQRLADDAWVCRSREGGEDTLFCGRLLGEWYRNDHGMGKGYEFPSWFIYSTRLVWAARMLVMGCPSKSHTVKPTSRWCPRTKSIRKCRWEIYIFQMVVDSQGICMMIMIFFPSQSRSAAVMHNEFSGLGTTIPPAELSSSRLVLSICSSELFRIRRLLLTSCCFHI